MKHMLNFFLCFVILCLFVPCVFAENVPQNGAEYFIGQIEEAVLPGEVISVPVYLTVSDTPVNTVQFNIEFDDKVFEFQKYKSSTDKGDHKLGLAVVGVKQNNPSVVGAVFTSSDGNTTFDFDNTRLCTLRFKVKDEAVAGTYSFDVTYSQVCCYNLEMEEYSSEMFTVNTLNVTVTTPAVIKGDVNGDGKITVFDAIAILKHISETEMFTDTLEADVNNDGEITVSDSVAILKYIARITNEL